MPFVLTEPTRDARLGFTVDDVRAMEQAGVLEAGERYELLDGEIAPMSPANAPHMRLKRWIVRTLTLQLQSTHWVDSEPTFYLEGYGNRSARAFTAPDALVYPLALGPEEVTGLTCDLVIEVASTTLEKDLGRKAALYARAGVRDYWVCDTTARLTWVHRGPAAEGYPTPTPVPFDALCAALLLPGVPLTMAEAG